MLHRKDYDEDILKSGEFHGPNLLLKAAKKVKRDEEVKVAKTKSTRK